MLLETLINLLMWALKIWKAKLTTKGYGQKWYFHGEIQGVGKY